MVPGPLVRWFARPYVAGDSLDAALELAERAWRNKKILSTLDLLGEDVCEQQQVRATVDTYTRLVDAIADAAWCGGGEGRPSISLKPSAFTTQDHEAVKEPIAALARRATERGVALTIDMEDHTWTDLTIEFSVDLFRQGLDVGTVLQTRLHRSESDVEKIPEGMRLRLVIGIYEEPDTIAFVDKQSMKERMLAYAKWLLKRGAFVEFATHDEEFLRRFAGDVAPRAPDRCEVQMLLGVPRARMTARLQAGEFGPPLPVRQYVPFAEGWADATAYLRRRMQETPGMMWLVLRNLFSTDRG